MLLPASRDLVTKTVTHPRNWKWLSESEDKPENYAPKEGWIYLAHNDYGFISFQRNGRYLWAAHVAMLPKAPNVIEFCLTAIEQIHTLLDGRKFMAAIPVRNRAARRLALACGFVEEGRITNALFYEDKLIDMILYGKSYA